jgi:hypothetical protein
LNFSGDLLGSRRWIRREQPFPHIIARSVFSEPFHAALDRGMKRLIRKGLSEGPDPRRLSRNIPGYDAYALGFRPESVRGALGVFLSAGWRDLVCGLFGVAPTPYLFAGAHYHLPGSQHGFVHNDYNPVWFPLAGNAPIRVPDQQACSYKTGAGSLDEGDKAQLVRAVALIFFTANDGWTVGDGGETGLYRTAQDRVCEPAIGIPPENNSLVAFECSPRSFHSFIANRRPRASVIMWTHCAPEVADRRFGLEHLEHWQ